VNKPDVPLLDERVAREKFAAAWSLFNNRREFRPRGWEIEKPVFPFLKVMFEDRRRRPKAGVRLQLRNYDALPPSLEFLDDKGRPHTQVSLGILLRPPEESHVPPYVRNGMILQPPNLIGYLPGNHPFTERPFLCIRGTWEFHVHPQHADILWEWIRADGSYSLQYLLEHAHHAFRPEVFA
jgi:hypothetical protein